MKKSGKYSCLALPPTLAAITLLGASGVVAQEQQEEKAAPETEVVLKIVEQEVEAEPEPEPKPNALEEEKKELTLQTSLAEARTERELAALKAQVAKLKLEKELLAETIAVAELKQKQALLADREAFANETRQLSEDSRRAKMEAEKLGAQLKTQEAQLKIALGELSQEKELFEAEQAKAEFANAQPVYLDDPLKENGTLVISDRRIALNGPITNRTADMVTERINFYNNKDKNQPIFIVIDSSPGGSVMAGLRILKSMHGADAPVYTVVKSFAASMAAGITTLAERSFAYPDAVIMHHQILSLAYGNLTETREHTQQMEKWWNRLAQPVADKMGITLEEFIDQMYENTVTGDWDVFGDEAVELKWVDHVVTNIEETSLLNNPDSVKSSESPNAEAGPSNILPRLNPKDMLYLYNPDNYYKVAE